MKHILFALIIIMVSATAWAGSVTLGKPLPRITIAKKGLLVFDYEIKNRRMVFKQGSKISYRKWRSSELTGKVTTVYHLAARIGTDEINRPFIEALIKSNLPDKLPDSPYRTVTILNTSDALWGTADIASYRFEKSQKEFPYALYVNDEEGIAQKAWGLKKDGSAVILLDKDGKVIYFKDGKMSPKDIQTAVTLIKRKLNRKK